MTWKMRNIRELGRPRKYSVYCRICGMPGARTSHPNGGKVHERCLPDETRRENRRIASFVSKAAEQFRNIAKDEGLT